MSTTSSGGNSPLVFDARITLNESEDVNAVDCSQLDESFLALSQLDESMPLQRKELSSDKNQKCAPRQKLLKKEIQKPTAPQSHTTSETIIRAILKKVPSKQANMWSLMQTLDLNDMKILLRYKNERVPSKPIKSELCSSILRLYFSAQSEKIVKPSSTSIVNHAKVNDGASNGESRDLKAKVTDGAKNQGVGRAQGENLQETKTEFAEAAWFTDDFPSMWQPIDTGFKRLFESRRDPLFGTQDSSYAACKMSDWAPCDMDDAAILQLNDPAFELKRVVQNICLGSSDFAFRESAKRKRDKGVKGMVGDEGDKKTNESPSTQAGEVSSALQGVVTSFRDHLIPKWRETFDAATRATYTVDNPNALGSNSDKLGGVGESAQPLGFTLSLMARADKSTRALCILGQTDAATQTADESNSVHNTSQISLSDKLWGRPMIGSSQPASALSFRLPQGYSALKVVIFASEKLGLSLISRTDRQGRMRTIIESKTTALEPDAARLLNVGDALVSIGNRDVSRVPWADQRELIKGTPRPIILCFATRNGV